MLYTTIKNLQKFLQDNWKSDQIGFVPTMGNLHAGHISLIKRSIENYPCCVVSIFVNPTQFGPSEDFRTYPRTLENDLEKIKELKHKNPDREIIVFAPGVEEIYPSGYQTFLMVGEIASGWEGKNRPGHFRGVATVVYHLLRIVKPDCLYLGQKDFQQYLVLKQMVEDLRIKVKVISCPIIRDSSGLALSSRNQYLLPEERQQALNLFRALNDLKNFICMASVSPALSEIRNKIGEWKKNDSRWDYLTLCSVRDLKELTKDLMPNQDYIVLGAYRLKKARLIDNLIVKVAHV